MTARQPWDDVYDQINIVRAPDWVRVPPATDAELDQVEVQLGSRLPLSYRAFMKRFGPGELESCLRLSPISLGPPGNLTLVEETLDQRAFSRRTRKVNTEWLGRVVYCGVSAGGEFYAWDPTEMITSECPIYWLRRHEEEYPQRRANSFFEFIQSELAIARELRAEEPPEEGIRGDAFEPWNLRMKEAPNAAEVGQWLAHSNVRDLALAIRDHGRTDAFPVLADALEEAGCTSADVLDSCRRGDPDIDGLWVLRVLLGK